MCSCIEKLSGLLWFGSRLATICCLNYPGEELPATADPFARGLGSGARDRMMASPKARGLSWEITWLVFAICTHLQSRAEQAQGAYFLPEFALSPQGSFLEDTTGEQFLTYRYDDQTSRTARSDEDKEGAWDAWGAWSDCSRTCGGGASYSLRRCLNGRSCEGRNIRYKTCSNNDCSLDVGDFRAQQCSAYNDVKFQGHFYEWLPVYNDPNAPCALKCQALGKQLVVELAPKVLDGTRCNTESLDMCISGICQAVGCDRQLGSNAKEDNCGICAGDGSTCRLVRGQAKAHVSPEKREEIVIAIPHGSRSVRLTLKGPAHLVIESKTLQGDQGEHSFNAPGIFVIENTAVEFQKSSDRETMKIQGPLGADFIIKTRYIAPKDSVVQFFFYQPISHQWRQTEFFPCTVTCGGGYQLNSAECVDIRLKRVVADHYCHYYPENKKPKPKLKECNMDPCPSSDGFKEIMPYDHFQPLPRWEHNPWTACSVSCGGGIQRRSFVCVEETIHGEILQVEEWKCMYAPKPKVMQTCNLFDCPKWVAMEWSQCTVTCGRGLRYRVVLCIDHHGQHVGGCNPQLKLHIKEECIVPVPCCKPKESPIEARLPWFKQAQEIEETRTASEEPMFIPEPWSPCSTTCGQGIQVRDVKCRVLLTFTQTEMDLPDEECEDPKPETERICHQASCDSDPVPFTPEFSRVEDSSLIYDWEYIGFTPCSATCVGGTQEAIAVCLHVQTKQAVNDTLCDSAMRPPAMIHTCNMKLCPPSWETGPWRQCSATCGVGIQTRTVYCQQSEGSIVANEECKNEKPHALQACNQIDCPPAWHAEEWQQCSHTCGGGTQSRKVHCKQLLTDGSFLKLSDEICQEPRLPARKSCAKVDCPPQLVAGEWSKCSLSCGVGIQRRKLACQKLTAKGQNVTLNVSMCSSLPTSSLVRSCHMNDCNKIKQEIKSKLPEKYAAHGPQIVSIHRVYIQTRQEKRINFTIGSRAYLLPKTSVVIKCPVRRFQKSLIQWEKDGQRLQNSKRLGITKSGSLKIHSLRAIDIGMYRCIAGSVHETFVLKLIGTDNRLIEPLTFRKHANENSGTDHNEANRFGAKWHKMSKMWQIWSKKNELYLGDGQVNDQPFLRNFGTRVSNSAEEYNSHEFKNKRLEAAVLQSAYSMDTIQFEELIRNMSKLIETGEISDDLASQVIYRLVAELSRPLQPTTEKLKGLREEKLASKITGKSPNISEDFNTKPLDKLMFSQKRPGIIRQKQVPRISFNKTVTVRIGNTVFLTKSTSTVNLLCETTGISEPKYTWTKDGEALKSSEKMILDSTGKVQILNPTQKELGMYGCVVVNDFGSDMANSSLLYAEAPVILSSGINVTNLEVSNLSIIVGGVIEARIGANITIECPVTGVPHPKVTWLKKKESLRNNSFLLLNESLFLQNVSFENAGTYSCTATSVLGKAVSTSVLHLFEKMVPETNTVSIKGSRRKRVLMASGIGTNISVMPGDLLRIGCPVHPNQRNMIHWFFRNHPIEEVKGLVYRALIGGRILEVNTMAGHFDGQYKCRTSTSVKPLSVWVNVKKEDYKWEYAGNSPCSATCGNSGTHYRRLQCVNSEQQKVNESLCENHQKPVVSYQSCNVHDCPASWVTSPWSECSASCGNGFRQRQVTCQQAKANGTTLRLSPDACVSKDSPLEKKRCIVHSCTEWIIHSWGQCSGRCVGRAVGLQHRHVICQHRNGSLVPDSYCDETKRSAVRRNCFSEMCNVYWQTGPWRPCSVDCGSGFQSRRVNCIHRKNNKPVADQYCGWRKRPMTWQHCNVTSCGKGECKDTTHYCTFVKHLKLCLIDLYKQRCCQSCQEV
ncbi:ADAMTS-like protein 3 isoform X2 [Pelodiscus sinensis]|uniref:ADAMTS-like protein 3 isoform X2 n=1 Tax=Pelodiscus sinensis TaxID=13735 RepID=UPI003F6BC5BF